ncbi:MAG TPA: LysR family transcriptional regulator [Kofleriaceae bacterium]|nr:LysR family transcriptional regulator [Kofleriaceae bacterium]
MDRIDEWRTFVEVAGRRSFSAAARALGHSPQAVTRAVAAVEERIGARLLHRTTRSVSLTGEGERYLERARRAVAEVDRLETPDDASAPLAGRLAITAPVLFGQLHVAPIVTAFLAAHPALDIRLLLVDRVVSLADEGLDVAVRIGELADSGLVARQLGHVRSVVVASPVYLRRAGTPRTPADLAEHACIAFAATTTVADRWSFPVPGSRSRTVPVRTRLTVNTGQAAIDAALAGLGVVRLLSYQVDDLVAAGRLQAVLTRFEPPPSPIHLVRLPGGQVRAAAAFIDAAAEALRRRRMR